jgi:hypothetical protein
MKKKVGVLGLMLTAAGLLFQPATAMADDFGHAAQARVEQSRDARVVTRDREPVVHRDVRDHGRREVIVKRDVRTDRRGSDWR